MTDSALPPEAPLEGVLLRNRYRVDSKIGQGGMASVYMAQDEELGRQVVVKVPLMRFMDMEGFRERFELEIQGLTDIEHPHVVGILARGEHDEMPYYILQYLAGGSLEDRIENARHGRLKAREVNTWLQFVAEALDFIHDHEIIHRDVKPGNILFDKGGNVALSDFGVAKALSGQDAELTEVGSAVGSPQYMAPEQATGTDVGPASDQYALGVTVFECLAGKLPFEGKNPLEVLVNKRTKQPPSLSEEHGIPEAIAKVVNRALAPEPADRYESCRAFSEAFQLALWTLEQTPAPGALTPLRSTTGGSGLDSLALERTMGGTLDFTGHMLLGHYEVGQRIGSGGMGTVFLAVDKDLGKHVVIKVPHFRLLTEKGFLARFDREVKQMLALEHPSVVRVLARGEHQGIPFFVLQYMAAGSLRDRLQDAPDLRLPAEDILPWFEATARALDFLHSCNLIHRDVKPGNLLFDEHEHAYLSDFGIAKVTNEEDQHLTTTNTGVGSPRYMAPEQTGMEFDGAADQYALATTVFEALAGRVPFEKGTAMEIMLRKMQQKPPSVADLVEGIPKEAADAVSRALAARPADRFPTCRALFLAFKRGLRGESQPSFGLTKTPEHLPTQVISKPDLKEALEAPAAAPQTQAPAPTQKEKAAVGERTGRGVRTSGSAAPSQAAARTKDLSTSQRVSRPRVGLPPQPAKAPSGLWQPAFVIGFVGVWLLARLAPFARFALPYDLLADVDDDVVVVLWTALPPALILAFGHGWLFQSRGVTRTWVWSIATIIGAAIGAAVLLSYPRALGSDLDIHPLGVVAGAITGAALGFCQWLALLDRGLRGPSIWMLATVLGAVAGAALIEFVGGGGGARDFLIVAGAALAVAAIQLLALRRMAPARTTGAHGA